MEFSFDKSVEILEHTPGVLAHLLQGIDDEWIHNNEGPDTWSVFDIMGHLIHGEKTDWMVRAELILSTKADKTFEPFDRFAQFEASKGKSLVELLNEFTQLRNQNMERLKQWDLRNSDFVKIGIHPVFGEVTMQQLLATWVVHDLNHLAQIARVMAKQYKYAVGPWIEFLGILK